MKLLFNTHCNNEFQEGCEWAFLDLTPELAALILQRREALKAAFSNDSHAVSLEYDDDAMVWLNELPDQLNAETLGFYDGEPFIAMDANTEDFDKLAESTDGGRMVCTSDEVYWT